MSSYAFESWGAPQQPSMDGVAFESWGAPVSAGEDVAKSLGVGVGKGVLGIAGMGGDIGSLANSAANKLGISPDIQNSVRSALSLNPMLGPLLNGPSSSDLQHYVEKVTGPFYKPKTTAGEYAQTIGEFAPAVAAGPGGVARRVGINVLAPALASETAGQMTKGSDLEPYARVGGAIGGAMVPAALGRLITPLPISAGRQGMVDTLRNEGVTSLTAGQITGSKPLRYAESMFGDFPLTGGRANRVQEEGQRQFTEAATRRAGANPALAPEGMGAASPEVLGPNSNRLGQQFRDLSARNTLVFDRPFLADAQRAVQHYSRVPDSQQRQIVQGYVGDILGHVQNGQMPGAYYQEMRSRLSRQANGLRQSDPTLSEALRDLRNALDDAMGRSISPADREAWTLARRQYGAQKTIEKSASRAGEVTAEGNVTPANLRNTVAVDNRGKYARGEGDFADLARAGAAIMTPLPNSGTGQRLGMLTALATAGLPALAGRALMSRPVQGYLGNQVFRGATGGNKTAATLLGLNSTGALTGPNPGLLPPGLLPLLPFAPFAPRPQFAYPNQ